MPEQQLIEAASKVERAAPSYADEVNAQNLLKSLANNWKLTPATLAVHLSKGNWIPAKHLSYISVKVAQAIAKGNGRIIVSMPPRHGKSSLLSTWTPVWALEHFPSSQIMVTSYGADLSQDFGREIRNILQSNQQQLKSQIKKDSNRVAKFETDSGGSVTSIGMSGAITGRGADILLVDDYIKELKEALSPTFRDQIWNWFVTVAMTRLEPGASVIIVATRWHSDDLIGRILKRFPKDWEYIRFPGLAEPNDPLGRAVGDPLFPERISKQSLIENKALLGTVYFNALYQQTPVDETSQLANPEWLHIVDEVPYPHLCKYLRVWDFAASALEGDYTVGGLFAFDSKTQQLYLVNILRKQFSAGQVEQLVKATADFDGLNTSILIEQEPGASGLQLVDHFKRNVLPHHIVKSIRATTSKEVRAQPMLAAAEAGGISLVKGPWNAAYLEEFGTFPGGEHDDQIDVTSMAFNELVARKFFSPVWGKRKSRQFAKKEARFYSGATFGRR